MAFLHIAFLAGTLAVAVPIVLHLIMRQQPRLLEFPALRFIQARQMANQRQMRLRHWLLLALRCLLICLLALALARPSIVASGMLGDAEAPVAAAFVFDTNPRMQYRSQNQTRLEVAQETALWLMPQLPPESEVAVIDSRYASAAFAVDLSAARQRIERLDAATMTRPLVAAIDSALRLVRESEKQRKEIYVFTDLAKAAWTPEVARDLQRALKETTGVGIYLIDVGVKDPTNFGLGELSLSGQVLSKNSPLVVRSQLIHSGVGGERTVELYLVDRETGEATIRHQGLFNFRAGESQRTDFSVSGLGEGLHQGFVKIVGQDALEPDDKRYFTVEVRPSWRVLIAAPAEARRTPQDYAFFLAQALAPYDMRVKGQAAFDVEVVSTDTLSRQPLDGYAAVCLLDPQPLPAAAWQKLRSYVSAGGGLAVFLGRNATNLDAFNEPIVQELLPGKLVRQWRNDDGVLLAPDTLEHPLLAKFRGLESATPWEALPVFRHWQLGKLSDDAATILRYSNDQPAIVERPVGKGRVVVFTTPVSDPASDRELWNLLPTGEERWPTFVLANELLYYLVGSGQERLNYRAGEAAVIRLPAGQRPPTVSLTTPRGDQLRMPPDDQNAVVVTSTEMPGNYRLQAGGAQQRIDLGFSANLPPEVSQMERATDSEVTALFAPTPIRLAHTREEIDRDISAGRVGQELYPYLIVLVALILGVEQALSNRFYRDYDTAPQKSQAAKWAEKTAPTETKTPQQPVSSA